MPTVASFSPEWAAAPGMTIQHVLSERGQSPAEFAASLNRPPSFVASLFLGTEIITAELADQLASSVGSTARFWLARERDYRASLERLVSENPELQEWARELPIAEMRRLGWIRARTGAACTTECMQFFGVSSKQGWKQNFERAVNSTSYRKSASYESDPSALAAWLRRGEIEASTIGCSRWDPDALRGKLSYLRALTRRKSPAQFMPLLQSACSAAGVAVVVVQAPKQCSASGAARFLSPDRALIQVSQRYGTDDQFWFTFFHEIGHLLLHPHDRVFIDEPDDEGSREEHEANEFAARILIPGPDRARLADVPARYRDVIRFASSVGIAPGIVVGQMQHSNLIDFNRLNKAKRKLDWSASAVD